MPKARANTRACKARGATPVSFINLKTEHGSIGSRVSSTCISLAHWFGFGLLCAQLKQFFCLPTPCTLFRSTPERMSRPQEPTNIPSFPTPSAFASHSIHRSINRKRRQIHNTLLCEERRRTGRERRRKGKGRGMHYRATHLFLPRLRGEVLLSVGKTRVNQVPAPHYSILHLMNAARRIVHNRPPLLRHLRIRPPVGLPALRDQFAQRHELPDALELPEGDESSFVSDR